MDILVIFSALPYWIVNDTIYCWSLRGWWIFSDIFFQVMSNKTKTDGRSVNDFAEMAENKESEKAAGGEPPVASTEDLEAGRFKC